MSKDYWVIGDFSQESTKDLVSFLKEQQKYLEEKTSGNVLAFLVPYRFETLIQSAAKTSEEIDIVLTSIKGNNSKNASVLYNRSRFEFYITDKRKQYELELFELLLGDTYPVRLFEIDTTIKNEADIDDAYDLGSLEEFQIIFEKIVTTRKTSFIVGKLSQRMRELDEQEQSSAKD